MFDAELMSPMELYSDEIATFFPAFGIFSSTVTSIMLLLLLILAIFILLQIFKTERKLLIAAVVAVGLFVISRTDISLNNILQAVLQILLRTDFYIFLLYIVHFLVKKIIRANLFAYSGIIYVSILINSGNMQKTYSWIITSM